MRTRRGALLPLCELVAPRLFGFSSHRTVLAEDVGLELGSQRVGAKCAQSLVPAPPALAEFYGLFTHHFSLNDPSTMFASLVSLTRSPAEIGLSPPKEDMEADPYHLEGESA